MAIGLLRMSLADFGLLHIAEFFEALGCYRREKDADRRHIAELARGATLRLWNLQVERKDRIGKPELFWRMPWDSEEKDSELLSSSPEEREKKATDFLRRIKMIDE